jgi:hypothetical protein
MLAQALHRPRPAGLRRGGVRLVLISRKLSPKGLDLGVLRGDCRLVSGNLGAHGIGFGAFVLDGEAGLVNLRHRPGDGCVDLQPGPPSLDLRHLRNGHTEGERQVGDRARQAIEGTLDRGRQLPWKLPCGMWPN